MPEIQDVSNKHNSIMDFMLANPAMPLGQVANEFGCSQAWLSVIIHSNAFQARLRDKQDAIFDSLKFTLTDRMTAVAHDALDIVHAGLVASPNPDKALTVADTVLHRLGYAPQRAQPEAASVQVNNTFVVNANDLAAARESMQAAHTLTGGAAAIEHDNSSPRSIECNVNPTTNLGTAACFAWPQAYGGQV